MYYSLGCTFYKKSVVKAPNWKVKNFFQIVLPKEQGSKVHFSRSLERRFCCLSLGQGRALCGPGLSHEGCLPCLLNSQETAL